MSRRRHVDRQVTCGCGQPTPNGEDTCEACLNQLDTALGELPWLSEQLDVMVGQQHGIDTRGGSGSGDSSESMPFNDRASRSQRRLHHTLAVWVRRIHEAHVANQSPRPGLPQPADDPTRWSIPAMSRWLSWRVDGLAHHRMGHAASVQIAGVVAATTQQVLWSKPTRVFLGRCDMHAICDGEVYAIEGEDTGECESCGATYPVEQRRAQLEAKLDARLCSAADIAKLSTYLGLRLDREQVRKRINQWHKRKTIRARTHDYTTTPPTPLFRYGDVRPLLAREVRTDTDRARSG